MTREEHIYQLKQYLQGKSISMCPSSSLYWREHWEEVIKALEQESTTKNDLEVECVSRKEVEKLVYRFLQKGTDENIAFYEHFLDLPSVTPQEPKTGHWNDIPKYKGIAWHCSECEHFTTMKHNYCPKCGAKMVEQQEGEDK